jgi:hypothetical protein
VQFADNGTPDHNWQVIGYRPTPLAVSSVVSYGETTEN